MTTWQQTFSALPGAWPEQSYARFNPPNRLKKAQGKEYATWAAHQPRSVMRNLKPLKYNPRFAQMDRVVKVRFEDGVNLATPVVHKQRYVVCIDPKSDHAGNIYNTDSKIILYFKFFLSLIARPVHLIVKTGYHLLFIGVFRAIADHAKNKKAEKAALVDPNVKLSKKPEDKAAGSLGQRVVRSLVDIVRTPLYELIMIIVTLTALITAPFCPTLLYDFRAFTGHLTKELFWGAKYDMPVNLTPCMYRIGNIMDFEKNASLQRPDKDDKVVYADPTNPTLVALDNWMVEDLEAGV